ncbi:MAG: hypothetical protein FD137_463 [Spirochaetes bacterium]|nr:MAG: hypothetical protein FD137_463 [Spirochaetota bacterium]
MRSVLLACFGLVFVGLGVAGIFLPVLPTTPFLLLAAACFIRSSPKLYAWLVGNRIFGEYLRRYWSGEGMSKGAKIWTISFLWFGLGVSFFLVPWGVAWRKWLLPVIGAGVTAHLLRLPTKK